ncbi:MAG: hypothetical protein WKG06_30810 [Segetibacter sp.]
MEGLPIYIPIVFGLTAIFSVWLFYKASNNSKITLIILLAWLAIQAKISLSGFYQTAGTFPLRFLLIIIPPFLLIIGLFISPKGRQFIDSLDIKKLTILHIVRIPVEIVLFCLFINNVIPKLMTFEGRNFDIFAGLTAPIIFYLGFIKRQLSRKLILIWNFICLLLLFNIVINAVLSAPFPFQKFAFDQPNIAILYFPFNWLP